jgi:hypothetical protein
MKRLTILFLVAMPLLLTSCVSAPKGGPTKYALDRSAKLPSTPEEAAEEGEELKFGLFCIGKMCSEHYKINFTPAHLIPIVGSVMSAANPDKPSTIKLFKKKRKFESLTWLTSFTDYQDSDLIVKLSLGRPNKTDVISVYSKRSLYQISGGNAPSIGAMVYDAFKPGTSLYRWVMTEREAHLKRQEQSAPAGSLSKEDLEGIVKAAVAGAASAPKKESEAPVIRSDVDTPGYKTPENPDDFALVIGIEKYSNLDASASFAERDATAVQRHLFALGFPVRNVHVLLGGKATRTALEKYLEHWLPLNVKETSRVFFYFSGHGAPDVKTGQAFLVPWDGDPNFLESTAYPVSKLYEKLNSLEARQVLVALDACFSGAGGRSVLAKGARPLVTKIDTGDFPEGKLALLAAASAEEITSSLEEQGHGIFTYYLLKGLSGAAKDGSGAVTIGGLLNYLKPKVQDEARRQGRDQTPVFKGGQNAAWVIRHD